MSESRQLLALIVLYGMTAEQSPAFRGLEKALAEVPAEMDVVVFDNSPQWQPAPEGFAGRYVRDQSNPGLAAAYNAALAQADGHEWLLLLDQDTTVTPDYLRELIVEISRAAETIVAFVPKLLRGSAILSPLIPPFSPAGHVPDELNGVPGRRLHMFNSGAALRVSSLVAMGGFPEDFPLDALDHATFHQLQSAGGEVFVLRSGLQHSLSHEAALPGAGRHRSMLQGQSLYYRRFGTALERRSFRRDLVRQALLALRAADFARAGRFFMTALRAGSGR